MCFAQSQLLTEGEIIENHVLICASQCVSVFSHSNFITTWHLTQKKDRWKCILTLYCFRRQESEPNGNKKQREQSHINNMLTRGSCWQCYWIQGNGCGLSSCLCPLHHAAAWFGRPEGSCGSELARVEIQTGLDSSGERNASLCAVVWPEMPPQDTHTHAHTLIEKQGPQGEHVSMSSRFKWSMCHILGSQLSVWFSIHNQFCRCHMFPFPVPIMFYCGCIPVGVTFAIISHLLALLFYLIRLHLFCGCENGGQACDNWIHNRCGASFYVQTGYLINSILHCSLPALLSQTGMLQTLLRFLCRLFNPIHILIQTLWWRWQLYCGKLIGFYRCSDTNRRVKFVHTRQTLRCSLIRQQMWKQLCGWTVGAEGVHIPTM